LKAKTFLKEAKHLDTMINSKIVQIKQLNELAVNASSVMTGMPHNPNRGRSTMADAIGCIVDLQAEINRDIDTLVGIKRKIRDVINAVPQQEYRAILEKRYLCLESWEKISSEMVCDLRWLYRLHGRAIVEVQKILDAKETDQ